MANESSRIPATEAPAFTPDMEEVTEPGPMPEPEPEPEPEPKPETLASAGQAEPDINVEPEPEPKPSPSPYAPTLAQRIHAPVNVHDAIDTPDGVFVTYSFNTLASHLGALTPKARALAEAKIKRFEARCKAQREVALSSFPENERHLHDFDPPCSVQAAWSIVDRPPPNCGKHSCAEAPDDLSPHCDALGVALMSAHDVVKAQIVLTQESCLASVEPIQRERLTGEGRAELLVTATHELWDASHYWGWSVNTSTRRLLAFKLDSGRIEQVLDLLLDEYVFLDGTLRSSGRYTIERPGVIRRYSEAWNSLFDGVQIDELRWNRKSQAWSKPKIIVENYGSIPKYALPLDRDNSPPPRR